MAGETFDPVAVEAEMIRIKMLPVRADTPPNPLEQIERHFTERDLRKYALWRISMVRQFQPTVLRRLTDDDLLYLAGQSAEGYVGKKVYGIKEDRNKITQNALRARIELETRATRGAWRRNVILAFTSLLAGAILTVLATWAQAAAR